MTINQIRDAAVNLGWDVTSSIPKVSPNAKDYLSQLTNPERKRLDIIIHSTKTLKPSSRDVQILSKLQGITSPAKDMGRLARAGRAFKNALGLRKNTATIVNDVKHFAIIKSAKTGGAVEFTDNVNKHDMDTAIQKFENRFKTSIDYNNNIYKVFENDYKLLGIKPGDSTKKMEQKVIYALEKKSNQGKEDEIYKAYTRLCTLVKVKEGLFNVRPNLILTMKAAIELYNDPSSTLTTLQRKLILELVLTYHSIQPISPI